MWWCGVWWLGLGFRVSVCLTWLHGVKRKVFSPQNKRKKYEVSACFISFTCFVVKIPLLWCGVCVCVCVCVCVLVCVCVCVCVCVWVG